MSGVVNGTERRVVASTCLERLIFTAKQLDFFDSAMVCVQCHFFMFVITSIIVVLAPFMKEKRILPVSDLPMWYFSGAL